MSPSRSAARPVSLKTRQTVFVSSRTHYSNRRWPRPMVTLPDHSRRRNPTRPFRKQQSTSKTQLNVAAEEQPIEDAEREVLVVGDNFNVRSRFSDAINRGRVDIAGNCLSEMEDVSILDFNRVMQLCVQQNRPNICHRCFIDLKQRGFDANNFTYSILLNLAVQKKDLREGLMIIEQINEDGVQMDTVLYNLLIKLYMVCNKVSEAMKALHEMEEAGIEQTIVTYNYILGGHCRPSNGLDSETVFKRVQELFEEMQKREIPPDARTYGALSRAALQVERIDLVEKYINEIMKSGDSMKESDYVVLIYAFVSRIWTEQQDRKIELSWDLLLGMRRRGLNLSSNSLDAFTSVYASFQRLDLVFGVWNYYQLGHVRPSSTTYLNLLQEVSSKEDNGVVDHDLASSFIELMDRSGLQLDREMLECLLQLMVKHRHVDGALRYLAEMKDRRLRLKTMHYNLCLTCLVERHASFHRPKTTDLCLNLMKEMKQSSIPPNDYTYFTVLRSAMYSSNWSVFQQVLDLMKEAQFTPSTKTSGGILSGCSKMEDSDLGRELAWEYFQQMKDFGQIPSVASYTIMMNFCIQTKEFSKGIDLFNEMQGNGIQPTIQAYTTLLCLYGDSGDLDKALELFEEMKTKGLGGDKVALHCMIRACGLADRFDKAVELFSEMKTSMKPDARAYGSMIYAAGSCRRSDWVMQYYEEMMKDCDYVLVSSYNCALRALIDCEAYDDAKRVLMDMESRGYRPGEYCRKALAELA